MQTKIEQHPAIRPLLWVLLAASLALNLLAAGYWAGKRLHRAQAVPDVVASRPHVERFIDSLPETTRADVRAALAARENDLAAQIAAVRQARLDVADALDAQPFKPEAVALALDTLRERESKATAIVHEIVLQAVIDMPPEARAAWQKQWRSRARRQP